MARTVAVSVMRTGDQPSVAKKSAATFPVNAENQVISQDR
jgi:hypothetical protein